jgi:flagellar protein FliS
MNEHGVAFAYQQSSARSATPIGQVVALYDTILRDFRRALEAAESGEVEKRVFELNHSLTVIAYLQSILDHQRGGEAAKRLQRFYEVTHAMILQANANGNRDTLNKLIELYASLRQAWQEVEAKVLDGAVPVIPAVPSVSNSAPPSAAAPKGDLVEVSRSNWSA